MSTIERLKYAEAYLALTTGLGIADGQLLCRECGAPLQRVDPPAGSAWDGWRGFGCPCCPYAVAVSWSEGFFAEHGRGDA